MQFHFVLGSQVGIVSALQSVLLAEATVFANLPQHSDVSSESPGEEFVSAVSLDVSFVEFNRQANHVFSIHLLPCVMQL